MAIRRDIPKPRGVKLSSRDWEFNGAPQNGSGSNGKRTRKRLAVPAGLPAMVLGVQVQATEEREVITVVAPLAAAARVPGPGAAPDTVSRGPRGSSNAAFFSMAGGKLQTHRTTGQNDGGSYTSYNIADHMSGLNIGAGKPSAGALKQAGLSKGQPSSNALFTAFESIGEGEVDTHGNPVYYGIVLDKKGKDTAQRVSVDIYGMTIGQSRYFCFNSKGNAFDKPPDVSEKDPKPERAEKLYKLAKKLYLGKMTAAPTSHDYYKVPQTHHGLSNENGHAAYGHDGGHNTTYWPSTASSGGSGGEYTTRPGSRDGTTGPTGYASVPRTAAYGQHSEAYCGAPGSRPSSRGSAGQGQPPVSKSSPAGGGPSKPPAASKPSAAQKNTLPPRNVKLDVRKSKKSFTMHGIDRGKPYIKGVDGERDTQHYDLSYSDKYNRFYISMGQTRKDRVYLIET
ncbi:hypothetical protein C7999DRAFT_34951 [Corynascus novoguineensis]|uniref:Uncharacterized protein n=1 Tax=Corynascus novoguineensis TaxID=1126955 RepID=A0AAN7CMY5_9PEZI|nr:hypothetical protein C7999DRAFT_34951 [Corynascus novoguineensis]